MLTSAPLNLWAVYYAREILSLGSLNTVESQQTSILDQQRPGSASTSTTEPLNIPQKAIFGSRSLKVLDFNQFCFHLGQLNLSTCCDRAPKAPFAVFPCPRWNFGVFCCIVLLFSRSRSQQYLSGFGMKRVFIKPRPKTDFLIKGAPMVYSVREIFYVLFIGDRCQMNNSLLCKIGQ